MRILSTIIVIIFTSVVMLNAQTFEVYDNTGAIITGQTILVPTTVNSEELVLDIKVKNKSANPITARIGITLLTEKIEESMHSMCNPTTQNTPLGQCGSNWGANSQVFELNAGETSNYGQLHFTQGPNSGVTTIEYKVYDTNNASDFITFTITYSSITAINLNKIANLTVAPNPASNFFTLTSDLGAGASVEIYNVLGKLVKKVDFSNAEKISVDCSNWENGYYFCRLFDEGKIKKTVKLIVTH